ncbi:hypothetical protein LCM4573_23740 [Rhizobium sp. LCM 4573]|nr:hypothetical protein LCM4573_23740 [Rhizobium sp. LCM 4573]
MMTDALPAVVAVPLVATRPLPPLVTLPPDMPVVALPENVTLEAPSPVVVTVPPVMSTLADPVPPKKVSAKRPLVPVTEPPVIRIDALPLVVFALRTTLPALLADTAPPFKLIRAAPEVDVA